MVRILRTKLKLPSTIMEPFSETTWKYTTLPNPEWTPGSGASNDEWKKYKKIAIDPYDSNREPVDNYKMLISAVVPRPIGFVSTVSTNGMKNLAPFSYFTVMNHDPPIFSLGFSAMTGKYKDTCANILLTGELTISIISEWFLEAANFCAINAPSEIDEWELSGLTPVESQKVKPPHVAESAFSIEAKLVSHHEWKSKSNPELTSGVTCLVEGINFHAREDVVDEEKKILDISKLKPVSRLGGITYGRTTEGYQLPRPSYK